MEGGDLLRIGKRNLRWPLAPHQPRRHPPAGGPLNPVRLRNNPRSPVTGLPSLKIRSHLFGKWHPLRQSRLVPKRPLAGYTWIDVSPNEPHAANALAINHQIIFPASFPDTKARIEVAGFSVIPIDISERSKKPNPV